MISTPSSERFAGSLAALISADLDAVQHERRAAYLDKAGANERRLVVFGAAALGCQIVDRLSGTDLQVIGVADNSPIRQGTQISGLIVTDAAEAARRYGNDAVFVVAIYNGSEVRDQLKAFGCRTVVSFIELFWAYPEIFLPHACLADPAPIWNPANLSAIVAAHDLFADDESRQTYSNLLRLLAAPRYQPLQRSRPASETYFDLDIISLSGNEVYVDCGAYDGDGIRAFLNRAQNHYQAIIAVEPDPVSAKNCRQYIASLPQPTRDRIMLHNCALSDRPQSIQFNPTGSVTSAESRHGAVTVPARTLDDLLSGSAPTLIKMHVEGAELAALRGASATLAAHAPTLAVCAYHSIRDLWQIPLQIAQANPAYRIYPRRYAEDMWESVCYATISKEAAKR